jgi:hypothetical protein
MTRLLALCSAAVLVLAGCGSAAPSNDPSAGAAKDSSPSASPSSSPTDCPHASKAIAQADVDGDGTPETIDLLTTAEGDCPDSLSAGRGPVAELRAGEPPIGSAYAVTVPGREGQLVVTRQDHPRGGFQLRVYAGGEGGLAELEVDDQSLLPFVALDVQEHPWSIDCGDGGLVFTEAVAHEPRGVAAAWDVKRTTYAVDGTGVTAGPTQEVADNVLPGQLDAKYPDLVKHTAFASCRS